AIFISIDDQEVKCLRAICDEIFGEENFVVPIIWQKRVTPENRRAFSFEHDYVLCYAKNADVFGEVRRLLPLTEEARNRYKNPDKDIRGDWQSVPAIAQAGHGTKSQFYKLKTPDGRLLDPPSGSCWRYTEERMIREISENRIWFGADGKGVPRIKRFLLDTGQGITPSTLWLADKARANEKAKKELSKFFSVRLSLIVPSRQNCFDECLILQPRTKVATLFLIFLQARAQQAMQSCPKTSVTTAIDDTFSFSFLNHLTQKTRTRKLPPIFATK